jgi:iron-sulfur cluster assembly protein
VTVDFADTPLQSGLTFVNPNAEACGCSTAGESKPPAQATVSLSSIKRL